MPQPGSVIVVGDRVITYRMLDEVKALQELREKLLDEGKDDLAAGIEQELANTALLFPQGD